MVLAPGRAKLATKPPQIGSVTEVKTIGTVRVACRKASTAGAPAVTSMSPVSAVRPEVANHQWRKNPPGKLVD